MRLIPTFTAAVVLALVAPFGATGVGDELRDSTLDAKAPVLSISLNAMLISASSEKGESDRRLAGYLGNLKSSLRFESFKFLGEGSSRIDDLPGETEIELPQGHKVRLEAAYYGEGMVWLRVIWMDGSRVVMNVVYAKWPRGKPIVAGTTKDGQNLAIIVTAR